MFVLILGIFSWLDYKDPDTFHNTTQVESDFSLIKWYKDDSRNYIVLMGNLD